LGTRIASCGASRSLEPSLAHAHSDLRDREKMSPARQIFAEAFLARVDAAVDDLDAFGALRECGIR